ncbi:unnamed protein product [Penicillium nalgiovense]|nr:unnamed protein product [Penicillium nalgiovense]
MGPQILETALTRKTRDSQICRRSNTMHQSKGHSSSLVLTIRKLKLWELPRVALITLHYRQCSTQSHGLHTIPSPIASNNAACPRWKIADQDSESTTGCGNSSGGRRACFIASSALVPTAFALLWSPEPLASRHIHPPWKCNVYRGWVRNAFTVSTNCLVHPSAAFFEASADCDELECDVAWLVTALQRVVSDLVVKPIWPLCKLIVTSQAHFGIPMNRCATTARPRSILADSDCTTGEHHRFCHSSRMPCEQISCSLELPYTNTIACSLSLPHEYIDDESQKVRIAHLGLFLPIDSAYRVILRFVYMIQLLNSDQPIPLPESYLWLSMQPFKYLQAA